MAATLTEASGGTFVYVAIDRKHDDKVKKGTLAADSPEAAIAAVLTMGLAPMSFVLPCGIKRLMCVDGTMTLCQPNAKPPGHCNKYRCGG